MLDEAMVGVSAGEVSPIIAGNGLLLHDRGVPGAVRLLTRSLVDHCLDQWCDAQPGLVPYTGQCSLHRGQIMRLRGAYDEALAEFALAQRRYREGGYAGPGRDWR